MLGPMEYRNAQQRDLKQLAILFQQYRQLSISLEHRYSQREALNWLSQRLDDSTAAFIIAIEDTQLVGFITLYVGFSSIALKKYWVLNDLYVAEQARGRGIARKLMHRAQNYALDTGAKGLELETAIDNQIAQSLYQSLGFIENVRYKRYFKELS